MFPFDLRYKRFIGIVKNPKGMNPMDTTMPKTMPGEKKYKVHIPELMPFIPKDEGIWCTNGNFTTKTVQSSVGIELTHGDNISIMNNKEHFIIFIENDINTCRIMEPTGNSNADISGNPSE